MGGADVFYIASACYYHSTSLLLKAARVLGYAQDIARYGKLRTGFVGMNSLNHYAYGAVMEWVYPAMSAA